MKYLKLFLAFPLLATIACSDDPVTDGSDENEIKSEFKDEFTEISFPTETGKFSDVYFAGKKFPVEEVNGKRLRINFVQVPELQPVSNLVI